jgi:hypothetical protein
MTKLLWSFLWNRGWIQHLPRRYFRSWSWYWLVDNSKQAFNSKSYIGTVCGIGFGAGLLSGVGNSVILAGFNTL